MTLVNGVFCRKAIFNCCMSEWCDFFLYGFCDLCQAWRSHLYFNIIRSVFYFMLVFSMFGGLFACVYFNWSLFGCR